MSRAKRVARVFCSFSSCASLRPDRRWLRARRRVGAEGLQEPGPLGRVTLPARGRALLTGDRREIRRRAHRVDRRADPPGELDDVTTPDPRPLVAREPPREPDMALRRARRVERHRRVDPVAARQQLRHGSSRWRAQTHVPAPAAQRDDDVLQRRGAQHPHRARHRLLDRLEQRVRRPLGEPVRVFDDDDPVAPDRGPVRREHRHLPGLGHLDRQPLRRDDLDVGVRAVERRAALPALPAALSLAQQGRREGACGAGATRARRAREEPRMRHPVRIRDHRREGRDRLGLPDEVVPHAHGALPELASELASGLSLGLASGRVCGAVGAGTQPWRLSRIAAAISCGDPVASSTR